MPRVVAEVVAFPGCRVPSVGVQGRGLGRAIPAVGARIARRGVRVLVRQAAEVLLDLVNRVARLAILGGAGFAALACLHQQWAHAGLGGVVAVFGLLVVGALPSPDPEFHDGEY